MKSTRRSFFATAALAVGGWFGIKPKPNDQEYVTINWNDLAISNQPQAEVGYYEQRVRCPGEDWNMVFLKWAVTEPNGTRHFFDVAYDNYGLPYLPPWASERHRRLIEQFVDERQQSVEGFEKDSLFGMYFKVV